MPRLLPLCILLLGCSHAALSQFQMPAASFSAPDGEATFAVYNGKVYKIPKKEEPESSGWFNFDLLDNAVVRTLLGWSDYFTGASSQPDMFEEINNMAASQNTAQYALPGQQFAGSHPNALKYSDSKYPPRMPQPPKGFQGQNNFYRHPQQPHRPLPPSPPMNMHGNGPLNSQFPPRPVQNFQPVPPAQPPIMPSPQFQMAPPAFQQAQPQVFQQSQPQFGAMPQPQFSGTTFPKYNLPTVEVVSHLTGEGDLDQLAQNENTKDMSLDPHFKAVMSQEALQSGLAASKRSDTADKSPAAEVSETEMTVEISESNPCPVLGQWKYENGLCVALGNFPKWGCDPKDLVGTRKVVVCRKKVWLES